MNILLLDTSSQSIQFSYWRDGEFIIKEHLPPGKNADSLIYFIKKSFTEKNIDLNETEYVSLSNGPGSFTGLRIGSAIAKGICFCTGSRLVEISSLDIIANKYKGNNKFISMIFSNMRTQEFYYCEYEKEEGKLNRISDYGKDIPDNFLREGYDIVINDVLNENLIKAKNLNVTDVSKISDPDSHLELTLESIKNGKFVNIDTSEPFYMTEFIPKI